MTRRSKREPFYIGIGLGLLVGSTVLPLVLWAAGYRWIAAAFTVWALAAAAVALPAARKDAQRARVLLRNPENGRRSPAAARREPPVMRSKGAEPIAGPRVDVYDEQEWLPRAS